MSQAERAQGGERERPVVLNEAGVLEALGRLAANPRERRLNGWVLEERLINFVAQTLKANPLSGLRFQVRKCLEGLETRDEIRRRPVQAGELGLTCWLPAGDRVAQESKR